MVLDTSSIYCVSKESKKIYILKIQVIMLVKVIFTHFSILNNILRIHVSSILL